MTAIDILEFWKRVTPGSKVLTIWGQILRSRMVPDFNENMTWINTVFGSVIGCVTKLSSKTSCRPTELAVRPTAAAALSERAQRQCRCVQRMSATKERSAQEQRSVQRRSAQRRSEGAFSERAQRRSAQRRSEGAFSEGAQRRSAQRRSEGAHYQRAAKEHLAKSCGSPRRCAVLTRGQPRMEPRPRLSGEMKFEGTEEPHPAREEKE